MSSLVAYPVCSVAEKLSALIFKDINSLVLFIIKEADEGGKCTKEGRVSGNNSQLENRPVSHLNTNSHLVPEMKH